MKYLRLILFTILFIPAFIGHSTHLVGGEIYYEKLGGDLYKVSLIVYRDCYNGIPELDATVNISIYEGTKLITVIRPALLTKTKLPSDIYDSCFSVPSGVCVERGYYEYIVALPQNRIGYTLTWQRCCRNGSIKNIPNPGDWGSTITTDVPTRDSFPTNSAPVFNKRPPIAICLGSDFKFDNSATDIDGDSLVYELCDVLHGGGTSQSNPTGPSGPVPATPTAPAYMTVPWNPGYSATNPIDGKPNFSIDPVTGLFTGTPILLGQYVFGICVKEYRDGKFVGVTRREYQVNIKACFSQTVAAIFAPTKCNGLDLTFKNDSRKSTSYLWDFGDPSVNNDTSRADIGKYVYPDSGTYKIRLIANPGSGCADTVFETINIYHGVEADIQTIPDKCETNPVFDFFAAGKYQSYTNMKWTFGGATPDTSNEVNPKNITYPDTGRYLVTLSYEHKGCRSSVSKYATVFPNLIPDFYIRNNSGCTPLQVQLEDRSQAWTDVHTIWKVDNETYTDSIKRFTFTEPGEYVISHQAFTKSGCRDTLPPQFKVINVFSGPTAGFDISETEVSIFDPTVSIIDKSYNRKNCILYLGDEDVTANCNATHKFTKPGKYKVSQIVKNDNGCTDTASSTVEVTNEFAFFIPSTFTPNNDGLNEIYKPILIGVKEIEFTIYDRWGTIVFQTSELHKGWNGKKKNDLDDAPVGTYVYKIRAKDFLNEFHFYSDNVYLVR